MLIASLGETARENLNLILNLMLIQINHENVQQTNSKIYKQNILRK